MLSERLQILISPEQRLRLEAEAAEQGKSVGGLVREAIENRYARSPRAQRMAAVQAIKALRAEVPDDPADLDRMIDESRLAEATAGLETHASR